MFIESWVVLVTFILFIIYFLVMSFVSQYYKDWMNAKWGGRWVNFSWMMGILLIFAILMVFNVECTINGQCRYMALTLTAVVVILSILHMSWGIYHTVKYKK